MSVSADSNALPSSYTDCSCIPVNAAYDDIKHLLPEIDPESSSQSVGKRRGPSESFVFPTKLYDMLSRPDLSHIITWIEHGRSWRMIDKIAFEEQIMKNYFAQTKYPSFIRQVNGWGFKRITQGIDRDSYYNELFLRTRKDLIKFMKRHSAARGGGRASEPNLYAYPPLPPNPQAQIHNEQAEDSTIYSSEPVGTTDAHTGMRPSHHGPVHIHGHHRSSSSSAAPSTRHDEPDFASSRSITDPSYSQHPYHHYPNQDQSYATPFQDSHYTYPQMQEDGYQYNRGLNTNFSQYHPQQVTSSMNLCIGGSSATTVQVHYQTNFPVHIDDGAHQGYSNLSASELDRSSYPTFCQEYGTYSAEHRKCKSSNDDSWSLTHQQRELPETCGSMQQSNRVYDEHSHAAQEFQNHSNAAGKKRQQGPLHLSPPSVEKDDPPRYSKKRKSSRGIQTMDSSAHPQPIPPSSRGFSLGGNQDSQAKATSADTIIEPLSVNQYSKRPSSPLGYGWGVFIDVFHPFKDVQG